ncbi:hypothetical protein Sa4125_17790 [Aureimonas sp. SA4125]|uniref:hypothetical protein n=1 Tax=Aureimonas sp. SA4125 TaxID=2826993 RepID=UPI001CC463F8|nr:hypothetical protein [Aureimonas sp. SA4125]BDA84237.1 hypothetical protein Sa4125_17790 [Aureimonas sp. SA4125]
MLAELGFASGYDHAEPRPWANASLVEHESAASACFPCPAAKQLRLNGRRATTVCTQHNRALSWGTISKLEVAMTERGLTANEAALVLEITHSGFMPWEMAQRETKPSVGDDPINRFN